MKNAGYPLRPKAIAMGRWTFLIVNLAKIHCVLRNGLTGGVEMRKKGKYNVAIVGATGAVGNEMIEVLEERGFPIRDLKFFASERSAGETLPYKEEEFEVDLLGEKV